MGNGNAQAIFVARQPVLDDRLRVWGYELLFRSSATAQVAEITDPDQATLHVIADGVAIARPGMDPDKKVMINFPRSLLSRGVAFALPPEHCVVEILETVEPDPDVLEACRRLKRAGYTLALDDFVGRSGYEPLLELADIVKVDVRQIRPAALKHVTKRLARYPSLKLLAEKVEDLAMFDETKRLGYHLFQGYFFSRPETVQGRKTSANQLAKLRLITELSRPDFNLHDMARILRTDASLSHRLLRYVNSVYYGVRKTVTSLRHALVLLGELTTREFLRVTLLTDLVPDVSTEELLYLSAQRGRFLELVAKRMRRPPLHPDEMFLLGLFSLLDALMGQPMALLMQELPIDDRIKTGLCDPQHALHIWITLLAAWEHADWQEVDFLTERLGLHPDDLARIEIEAMKWAQDVLRPAA